jgi:hypothetical protein
MDEFPAAMTTASRRGRARAARLVWAGAAAILAAAPGCKLDQNGVEPPLDRIAFPASALVDPDGHWLYVANSNSDLRYNSGTLVVVDLDAAVRDRFGDPTGSRPPWPVCPGPDRVRPDVVDIKLNPADRYPCCWDYLDHNILNCDERLYVPPASTVKIGSFSSGMQFQQFTQDGCDPSKDADTATKLLRPPAGTPAKPNRHQCNANCPSEPVDGRLFIGVRGNSSLTYVDTSRVLDSDGPRPVFSCSDPASADPSVCQITQTPPTAGPANMETPIHVPDEPYALVLDESQDLLYVGNLRGDVNHAETGGISLFDVSRPKPRAVPTFIGASGSFFNPDVNGNFGITSLTLRDNGQVYACSRYGTNALNVAPTLNGLCGQDLGDIALAGGTDVFTTPLIGAEIRGIQFLPDPNGIPAEDGNQPPEKTRAFVLQRVPPALVEFDSSTDPNAFGNFAASVLETCAGPTFLQAYDAGEGTRLYVTCFDAGQIYVFDPYVPRLISVINAGRGPAGLAFPRTPRPDHSLAYVVGFSANDIPVLDLTPGSDTQYHIVQRIGFPSLEPR